MKRLGFLAPILLIGVPAWAQSQSSVEGAVTYDAQRVAMTQVYARESRGSPSSTEPPKVVILFADRPAPAKVIGSRQAYYDAATAGEIRGFLLTLDGTPNRAALAIFAQGGAHDDSFVPDVFEEVELIGLKREGAVVSGHLRTKEPQRFSFDVEDPEKPPTYAIDVTFRVPIVLAPKPTQVLTGEAARISEPVAVAHRSLQLIAAGSIAELKTIMMPNHPAFEGLEGPDAKQVLAMARQLLPSPATFKQSVERVILFGDEAVVVSKDKDGSSSVTLRRDGGTWKMAPAPMPGD